MDPAAETATPAPKAQPRFVSIPRALDRVIPQGGGHYENTLEITNCLDAPDKVQYKINHYLVTKNPAIDYARMIRKIKALGFSFDYEDVSNSGTDILKDEQIVVYGPSDGSAGKYISYRYESNCYAPDALPREPKPE